MPQKIHSPVRRTLESDEPSLFDRASRLFLIFPHNLFVDLDAEDETPKAIEEERRLCYVGVTRARDSLTLTRATLRKKWGRLRETTPSRFLHEMFDDESPEPASDERITESAEA